MNKNVGGIDKLLRIVSGIVLIGYAIAGPAMGMDTGYNVWGWVDVIPLAQPTATPRACPREPEHMSQPFRLISG
jgi:hypothetical protein